MGQPPDQEAKLSGDDRPQKHDFWNYEFSNYELSKYESLRYSILSFRSLSLRAPNCLLARRLYEFSHHVFLIHEYTHLRPKILNMNGLNISDFASVEDALQTADEIISDNKKTFQHGGETVPHKNPLLAKFWYVMGTGKKRTISQSETKELAGSLDVKSRKVLHDANAFLDGLGPAVEHGGSAKIESVVFQDMCSQREKLRTA